MCGLVEALDDNDGKKKGIATDMFCTKRNWKISLFIGYMSRTIMKTAKNSFLNVLKSTHPMFSSLVYTSSDVIR